MQRVPQKLPCNTSLALLASYSECTHILSLVGQRLMEGASMGTHPQHLMWRMQHFMHNKISQSGVTSMTILSLAVSGKEPLAPPAACCALPLQPPALPVPHATAPVHLLGPPAGPQRCHAARQARRASAYMNRQGTMPRDVGHNYAAWCVKQAEGVMTQLVMRHVKGQSSDGLDELAVHKTGIVCPM